MPSSTLVLRLPADELKIIKSEAAACGLPVSTFVKATVRASLKSTQLETRIAELLERDRHLWKREMTAVLFVRELLLALTKAQGLKIEREKEEAACRQIIDNLFDQERDS